MEVTRIISIGDKLADHGLYSRFDTVIITYQLDYVSITIDGMDILHADHNIIID